MIVNVTKIKATIYAQWVCVSKPYIHMAIAVWLRIATVYGARMLLSSFPSFTRFFIYLFIYCLCTRCVWVCLFGSHRKRVKVDQINCDIYVERAACRICSSFYKHRFGEGYACGVMPSPVFCFFCFCFFFFVFCFTFSLCLSFARQSVCVVFHSCFVYDGFGIRNNGDFP